MYVLLFFSFSLIAQSKEAQNRPKFIDYKTKVQKAFNQNISLNLKDKKNRQFKTVLTGSLFGPPNFAGKYVIASWGCGSSCQRHAIINKINGEVFWPKEIEASFNLFACEMNTLEFKTDSKLLIFNEPRSSEGFIKILYYWDGKMLIKINSYNINYDTMCNTN